MNAGPSLRPYRLAPIKPIAEEADDAGVAQSRLLTLVVVAIGASLVTSACGANHRVLGTTRDTTPTHGRYDVVLVTPARSVRLPSQHFNLLAFPACVTTKPVTRHRGSIRERSCENYHSAGQPVACASQAKAGEIPVPVLAMPRDRTALLRFDTIPDEAIAIRTLGRDGRPSEMVGFAPRKRVVLPLAHSKLVLIETTYFSPKMNRAVPPTRLGSVLALHYRYYFCTS